MLERLGVGKGEPCGIKRGEVRNYSLYKSLKKAEHEPPKSSTLHSVNELSLCVLSKALVQKNMHIYSVPNWL